MIGKRDIAGSNIHYRFYPLEKFFECQARLGIHKVDLFGATPHVWIDAYNTSDGSGVCKRMQGYGLEPGIFIPEFSSMRYTLGSEGESGRKTWEYIKRCFDFASHLGTGQVAISANGFMLDREEVIRRGRLEETLWRICELAGTYDFKLLLLNHYADRTDMVRSLEDMKYCMQIVDSGQMFPAVDIASVYEAGEKIEDWFQCFGEDISYVSLSNTKFDGAKHCWGDGYLNLWEIMEILDQWQYRGAIGTNYMMREYLARPWEADERTRKMLEAVCG